MYAVNECLLPDLSRDKRGSAVVEPDGREGARDSSLVRRCSVSLDFCPNHELNIAVANLEV